MSLAASLNAAPHSSASTRYGNVVEPFARKGHLPNARSGPRPGRNGARVPISRPASRHGRPSSRGWRTGPTGCVVGLWPPLLLVLFVPGLALLGALAAYDTSERTPWLGIIAGAVVGMFFALVFGAAGWSCPPGAPATAAVGVERRGSMMGDSSRIPEPISVLPHSW